MMIKQKDIVISFSSKEIEILHEALSLYASRKLPDFDKNDGRTNEIINLKKILARDMEDILFEEFLNYEKQS